VVRVSHSDNLDESIRVRTAESVLEIAIV
jgi:hypothetical protein